MGDRVAGGKQAARKNKEKFGDDFYKKIGAMGGATKNKNKGFGSNKELARTAGIKGGTISRKSPK